MVGYENMNTYTQMLWDEFENQVANSSGQTDQANQHLVDVQGFISNAELVLNDGNTSYPVEVAFSDDWVETFDSYEALSNQLSSFYEQQREAQQNADYWSNVNGEVNLANFEGWLNLRTGRNVSELANKVFSVINDVENKLSTNIKDLSQGLSNEVARATEVEAELAKGLAEEIERAIKAEEGIDSKIADIISNTDLSSIDSFSEVVDSLNAEIARATDAEGVLTSDLAAEVADRIAGDEALAADLAKGLNLICLLKLKEHNQLSLQSLKELILNTTKSWLLTKLQMEKS
jgi:hypothetical protein